MREEVGKMRNAKICRVQLQLHGFTVYVAAAPGNGGTERVRVGMKERVESPHVRGPSCSSTCVTQFRNFSSLGNVGRKNRV